MQQNDKSRQRLGVTNWTATPEAFPGGLAALSAQTGWKYVAHNRYWGNGASQGLQLQSLWSIPTAAVS